MLIVSKVLSEVLNGQRIYKKYVDVKYNNLALEVLFILEREGYFKRVCLMEEESEEAFPSERVCRVYLKYFEETGVIFSLKVHNKPEKYVKQANLWIVKKGLGLMIISTTEGLLTDMECRERGIGGRVVCTVC